MFHKHTWKEIARTYAKSLSEQGFTEIEHAKSEHLFGKTTILWECTDCYKLRKEEMLGRQSTPLTANEDK